MKRLVVRCVGNGEVAVVELRYDALQDQLTLAEIVPTADPIVKRRVNHEVLHLEAYPELAELFAMPVNGKCWDMEAVEDLVLGYLNHQSETRVRLHEEWAIELGQAV
ncbi:MAG: hypothetical protein DPW16_12355 [Chloroflexi bacterium]|nr:hypothetical protein [Chloroflexota bacterium]